MSDSYAVLGNPISHSLSPFIHSLFAKETKQDMHYVKIEVQPEQFEQEIFLFKKNMGKGLNITAPFKQRAYNLVDTCTHRAQLAKAVNTIKFLADGELLGDNTDGIGLVRDFLINYRQPLKNKNILILGAGGAVRGIIPALLDEGPQAITVTNRTILRAKELAFDFNILCQAVADLSGPYDIIINGISSLHPSSLPLNVRIVGEQSFCYDLKYSEDLPFLKWASEAGATNLANGLGMLVEQAAESFYLWRGVRPQTQPVITLLKTKAATI